jgi:hypothetical protein
MTAQHFGDPIGHVINGDRAIIDAAMLASYFFPGMNLQFTPLTINAIVIGHLRILERDLSVILAVSDQNRAGNPVQDAA